MNTKLIILVVIIVIAVVAVVLFTGEETTVESPEEEITREEQVVIGFNCGEEFDYEGYPYKTVEIEGECWFAEDLRYDSGCTENVWEYSAADACGSQTEEYEGLFYQWNAVMDGSEEEGAQGICPDGWHIPTHDEWAALKSYLAEAGYDRNKGDAVKDPDVEGWCHDESVCGEIGFLALPTGINKPRGSIIGVGSEAKYWSSTLKEDGRISLAWVRDAGVFLQPMDGKSVGHSARCIQN